MPRQTVLPFAMACLLVLGACASSGPTDPATGPRPSEHTNATVRAVLYRATADTEPIPVAMAAVAPAVPTAAAPAAVAKASAAKPRTPPPRGKRTAQRKAAPVAAAPRPAAATSRAAARRPAPMAAPKRAPYQYTIELDSGGYLTLAFPSDQGLRVWDRVLVSADGHALMRR